MIRLSKATAVCPACERRFHQIDSTEERALAVVRGALDEHTAAEHPDTDQAARPESETK